MNTSFLNGTATIYEIVETFDGVEDTCSEQVLHDNISVQICCSDGVTDIESCGVKKVHSKEVQVRIPPEHTFPTNTSSDQKRNTFTIVLHDCMGYMGKFQVEDISCITLPSSGLYCYKLIASKMD